MKSKGSSGYSPPGAADVQPQAHAPSHAVGGSDPVTATAIGAADITLFMVAAALTNATGNTAITFPTGCRIYSPTLTYSGSASTRIPYIPTAGHVAGDLLNLTLVFPATAGIVSQLRNNDVAGTIIDTSNALSDTTRTVFLPLKFTAAGAWELMASS